MDHRPKHKTQNYQNSQKIRGENLDDFEYGNVLDNTPKAQSMKEMVMCWTPSILKLWLFQKTMSRGGEASHRLGKKMFANNKDQIKDKESLSKMHMPSGSAN